MTSIAYILTAAQIEKLKSLRDAGFDLVPWTNDGAYAAVLLSTGSPYPVAAKCPVICVVDAGQSPNPQHDDFFAIEEPIERIAARLQLRISEYQTRQAMQITLAKTETTVKQREEFLGVCAHDLRSPLALIQTSLSLAMSAGKLSEMQTELITRSRRQASQAIKLVNDLLDVMSLEQGLKPVYHVMDLHAVLEEFYKDYKTQAEQKKVKFHYDNQVPEWKILADADRIRQLLQNLFANALKFTEEGKNIFLSVAPFKGRRTADPIYPMVVVSLKDEGKGIPASETQKIFDRFTQLKGGARAEGRGLGLSVAKQISNLHDGNVWVQSEEGVGSTFFVLFPHVLSDGPVSQNKKRILVAEPNAQKRDLFYAQMEKWGYEVVYARDGIEALTLSHFTTPSLVILTPQLAKVTESEVVNILKNEAATRNIPVLFAADSVELAQHKDEVELFDESLQLPFTKEGFQSTIASLLDRTPKLAVKKAA